MASFEDRDRMHELAARTTRTHYFDHREIARQKKLLSYVYEIRDALDEHYWPAIQRHCQIDLRLGTEAKLKQSDENRSQLQ